MNFLIINADDYGLCDSVNQGIIECIETGAVSDLSFIVNASEFNTSDKRLKSIHKNDVGFHVNLTTGRSILGAKTKLVNHEGNYYDLKSLCLKLFSRKIPLKDIYCEIKAQIVFLKNHQYNITHIDSHRNIHLLPPIMKVLIKICHELGLVVPIRMPYESVNNLFVLTARNLMRISVLNAMTMYCFLRTRYKWNIRTIGGNFFNNAHPAAVIHEIKTYMKRKPHQAFELAVHPGYTSRQLLEYDEYFQQRITELKTLKMGGFKTIPGSIKICSFADLNSLSSGQAIT